MSIKFSLFRYTCACYYSVLLGCRPNYIRGARFLLIRQHIRHARSGKKILEIQTGTFFREQNSINIA